MSRWQITTKGQEKGGNSKGDLCQAGSLKSRLMHLFCSWYSSPSAVEFKTGK